MITSWHGNAFHIRGQLCVKSTYYREVPLTIRPAMQNFKTLIFSFSTNSLVHGNLKTSSSAEVEGAPNGYSETQRLAKSMNYCVVPSRIAWCSSQVIKYLFTATISLTRASCAESVSISWRVSDSCNLRYGFDNSLTCNIYIYIYIYTYICT